MQPIVILSEARDVLFPGLYLSTRLLTFNFLI